MAESLESLAAELRAAVTAQTAVAMRVDIVFRKLLGCKDALAPQLVVDILHGKHGADAARAAWKDVQSGIPLHNQAFVSQGTTRYSLAARCLMHGTVSTFEAVVLAGAPKVVPAELKPRTQTEWMDLVSSTDAERSSLRLDLMTRPDLVPFGAVGEIATFADVFPDGAQEAFEVVRRLDPKHVGFDVLAQEPSEAGAVVRAFLMTKGMAQAAAARPTSESPALSPRRRRASV